MGLDTCIQIDYLVAINRKQRYYNFYPQDVFRLNKSNKSKYSLYRFSFQPSTSLSISLYSFVVFPFCTQFFNFLHDSLKETAILFS